MTALRAVQGTFDELGTALRDATFCVVDLETTGGSASAGSEITEFGAVKVRAGEVVSEFQTLVRPHTSIPSFIAVLTGINDSMVASAPRIDTALPSFLEFAKGCVLVAHNAPFDVGFLRHFAGELGHTWPGFDVIDTAKLARRVLTRDEAPNCKLSTLARIFHASTTPNHRALEDARATVDVLHSLIARLGNVGVHTVEELSTFSSQVSTTQRRKRYLAEGLPHSPGVYLFRDAQDSVLYVGTSKDIGARVRSYFTSSETRSRMGEMVGLAERVEAIECATTLEAQVRELRLIAAHKPRYNKRSRFPERAIWVKLTREPWPRLSLVRSIGDDGADYIGPFGSRRTADSAVAALHEAFGIRQCTGRMPKVPSRSPCALAEMGVCMSPCDQSVSSVDYQHEVERVREAMLRDPAEVIAALDLKMARLSDQTRFEDAQVQRDRLRSFLRATARTQRLTALTTCRDLVAARRGDDGRWVVHVVRYGRLCAAGVIPDGADAREWVERLRIGAETVLPGFGPAPAASTEETERVLSWLEGEGTRLIEVDGDWMCPVRGATRHLATYDAVEATSVVPFDERRMPRTVHQPTR
ncbi:DEDD exonuclease domain-containing protein [Solicola gregarius]|uniref:DEDD exonuclease domain-containing protein n=1 Tax=Solicola gregarius TaxID=2908642 RepID=A0AA46TJ23_9ACTN|nr:DEDD exonuclease domain-containing protein [Solicola gregarius]UYM05408.1 DEDD exonuclease domain-containing protein [Solicola gregarius]